MFKFRKTWTQKYNRCSTLEQKKYVVDKARRNGASFNEMQKLQKMYIKDAGLNYGTY